MATEVKSLQDLANDIDQFLNDHKIGKANFVGWDIGACVALLLADPIKDSSSKVEKLVLVNPVGLHG